MSDDDEYHDLSDHDRLVRLSVEHRDLTRRIETLERTSAETSRVVTGWRGGMAMFLAIGGAIGWLFSHAAELVSALRGAK